MLNFVVTHCVRKQNLHMTQFYNDSIFWVELDKIKPNPYQPRREFNQASLQDLAESIRQYGILQPLVVTRHEVMRDDGGLGVFYELIAGERRLRASGIAGLSQVPVIIRSGEEDGRMKLELAIIENLQREDLNPVDRGRAFERLANEFGFKHGQIGQKVGKSREYVSNSIRLLSMPEDIQQALAEGRISEGHARPIMMLSDKPEEQTVLFKEILFRKLTVREAEAISRRIAHDKVRKKSLMLDPEILELEKKLAEHFGTRVQIEQREVGGKVVIDFSSGDDLRSILTLLRREGSENPDEFSAPSPDSESIPESMSENTDENESTDEQSRDEKREEPDDDLYSIKNFSI